MNSFVIDIAIEVKRAVLLEMIKPALGFNIAKVLELIDKVYPYKSSVIINNTFFLQKYLYIFL